MTTKLSEVIQQAAQEPTPLVKFLNWSAAILGLGTVLQLVNLAVGVLSAGWLAVQLYGHLKYELPLKRARFRSAMRDLGEPTDRGGL